jgi:sterol desaturase/sphingolipid hydroxylase (fatty acid hydroxylase superfamily)
VIEILEQHENLILFGALIGTFSVVAIAEMMFPRRPEPGNLGFRWLNNIGLAVVSTSVNHGAFLVLSLAAAWWSVDQSIGILAWLELSWWASAVLVLLVLGLLDYVNHRLMHAVPLLWSMHAVHHSDTHFDVTTTYRSHPGAAVILMLIRLPFIVALGAPVSVFIAYEAFRMAQDLWSHSNTRLPNSVERFLRYFIVTPDFHRIHHCSDRQFTDSNFSSALPLFDYLFGTYRDRSSSEQLSMEIGLEQFREKTDSRLDQMLLMPLRVFTSSRPKVRELSRPAS